MAVERIGRAVLELTSNATTFFSDIDKAKKEGGNLVKIFDNAAKSLEAVGSRFDGIGKAMSVGITAPLLAIGGAAMAAALEYQNALAIIQKSTGATGEALRDLGDDFREVNRRVPQESAVVAEALGAINARLGLTGQALQDTTVRMLDFARVNRAEVGESTRVVTQLMTDFGMSADQLPGFLDKLTAAAQASGSNVVTLAGNIGAADDALEELGFGVDESIALFASLERAGVEPTAMIAGLQKAMTSFAKEGVTDARQALGLLMERIKEAPSLTAAGKIAIETFGKSGVTMAADIRSGKLEFEDMLKVVQESKGTLDRSAESSKTFAERLSQIKKQAMDAALPLGTQLLKALEGLMPLLQSGISFISGLLARFDGLPQPIQSTVLVIGGLAAAAGPAIYLLGQLASSASSLAKAMKEAAAAGALSSSLGGLTGSMRGLLGVLAGPAGLVAMLAAGAAAFTLYKTSQAQQAADTFLKEAADMKAASKLVGEVITNVGEARAALAAFEAGKSGQKMTDLANATTAVVKAWELGAAAAKNLASSSAIATDEIGATTLTLKGFGKAVQEAEAPADKLRLTKERLAQADKVYTEEINRNRQALELAIRSMDKTGDSAQKIAADFKISEQSVNRFKRELEANVKAQEKAQTAAEKTAAAVAKQRDALEKLGIVTDTQVNEALDEFEDLVRLATAAGVPLDRALAALNPRLEELKAKADASGIKVLALNSGLILTREAVKRLAEEASRNIPTIPVVEGLSKLPGTMVEITGAGEIMGQALTDSFHHFGLKTQAELDKTAREAIAHFLFIKRSGEGSAEDIAIAFEQMQEAIAAAGRKGSKSFGEGMKSSIKAVAPEIIQTLGAALLSGPAEDKWRDVGGSIGSSIGGAIGAYFGGPIGQALGNLVGGAIGSWFGSLFDDTDYEKRVKAAAEDFKKIIEEEFGSGTLRIPTAGEAVFLNNPESQKNLEALRRQFQALGIDIDAALRTRDPAWIRRVLEEGRQKAAEFNTELGGLIGLLAEMGSGLPESLRPYIDGLRQAGVLTQENIDLLDQLAGDGEADWRKIQEAVERYGGDISKLGGTFQAQRLHESWQQIIDDIDLFERGGMSAVDILNLTKDKIAEVAQESIRFETEIPENMRPYIQALITAGELVDDNGEKITDIGKLKFGETLQTTLALLTEEIRTLIKTLGGVPAAAENAAKGAEKAFRDAKPTLKVGVVYEDDGPKRTYWDGYDHPEPDMQVFARGGLVRGLFGNTGQTDSVLAKVTPGEFVLTPRAVDAIGIDALRAINEGRPTSAPSPHPTTASSARVEQPINVSVDARGSFFDTDDRVEQLAIRTAKAIRRGGPVRTAWENQLASIGVGR